MKILGGEASNNGISYSSDNYIVKAKRLKNNTINVSSRQIKSRKIIDFISKIPFIRGLSPIFEIIITHPISTAIIVIITLIISFIFNYVKLKSGYSNFNSYNLNINIVAILIFLALCYPKVLSIGEYHGAEHKVFNTYENEKELTIENVKKESRMNERCGSNLAIFTFIIFYVILIFFKLYFVNILVSWSLGYEIFRVKNKHLKKIVKPLFFVGYLYQKYISTKEPSENEIEVGIKALGALIELD